MRPGEVLLLLSLLLVSAVNCQECAKSDLIAGDNIKCEEEKEGDRTKFIKVVRGRLGNHLWGYMHSLGLEAKFDIEPLITEESETILKRYFKTVRFKTVTKVTCGFSEHYEAFLAYVDEKVQEHFESKLQDKVSFERDEDNRLVVPPELAARFPVRSHVLIAKKDFVPNFKNEYQVPEGCPYKWQLAVEPLEILGDKEEWNRGRYLHVHPGNKNGDQMSLKLEGVVDKFVHDMQFQDRFVEHAQERLQKIRSEYLKRKPKRKKKDKDKELTFVGIHWRLTDHTEYELRVGDHPVVASYFLDAMHMYRTKFGRVAFVLASDDMATAKAKLALRNKEQDLFFAGEGRGEDPDATGNDLALLAQCNHTIISHGTYSYFAGFFSGGLRITPEHFKRYRNSTVRVRALDLDPLENPLPRLFLKGLDNDY